jgi:hypothetical protein
LQRIRAQIELTGKAAARSEGHQQVGAFGRGHRHQSVEDARAFRLRHLIVFGVGVIAQVNRPHRLAASLAQHLEAFAVERGFRRQVEFKVEERDLLYARRRFAAIDQARAAERPAPLPDHLDLFDVVGADRCDRARRVEERLPIETFRFSRLRLTGVWHCRKQRRGQREV